MTPEQVVKIGNTTRVKRINEEIRALQKERAAIIDGMQHCLTVSQLEELIPDTMERLAFWLSYQARGVR